MGFAPGIFCRTPTFYIGGGTAQNIGNVRDDSQGTASFQSTGNYSANVGVLIPFGSTVYSDCKRLASQIATDREISSDLSMIRACASLDQEGIIVDPNKFPTLNRCVIRSGEQPLTLQRAKAMRSVALDPAAKQKAFNLKSPKTEVIKN